MKLIFEVSMLDQIREALHDAGARYKTVKRIEVNRAEFVAIMRECGGTPTIKTVNSQGNMLFGYPLEVVG